ncbi:uncharacterized protein EKO05_0006978 [Ascochyta rabiei]|uniref:Uncharacterized protein n=1 Tax=Didymella rabiei TaxID=5454 RepID=A0A162Z520_DIDRA|nr:uncharacterized protein EKO05_0006978 [Ascochyta rabiei]KZM20399.1 hypothetical protein ST47_g8458 [Ascochyta rabiei]UPX16587.1 hypothetical protein EKO05_0006978 [Ascochyta rabiei]
MRWSLIVKLKAHIPPNHPAHPAYSSTVVPQVQGNMSRLSGASSSASPTKRDVSDVEIPTRKLRRRNPKKTSPSPEKSSISEPALPASLKAAILAKRIEWLEANKTGGEAVADQIEEQLEVLEQRALSLNATAFRTWRKRAYLDEKGNAVL